MSPFSHFSAVWDRCAQLTTLHSYLSSRVTGVLQPDELLRAEWVARVSALDLYIHELVAQRMVEIFEGVRCASRGYYRFQISNDALERVRNAATPTDAGAAFDLEIREKLSILSFQEPEKIADAVRLVSDIELWNSVAAELGASPATVVTKAKHLKRELSLVAQRRNKIAHEGDLKPTPPREPWPISRIDVAHVSNLIERVVHAIDKLV